MVPTGDGASPAPIDRPILEFLRDRLRATAQVSRAAVTDESGHLALDVRIEPSNYPDGFDPGRLTVQWCRNDDFSAHYRDRGPDRSWECRWDRHPNPHNDRDHFHPPPSASIPGEDASWPDDHRDVLSLVLEGVEERIATLWDD